MIAKFFDLLRRCYALAALYGRRKLFLLIFFFLANGLFQAVGVASIFPFLAIASDPNRFRQSSWGQAFLAHVSIPGDGQLLVVAGIAAIALLFASNLMMVLSEFFRAKYTYGFGHWLRCSLLDQVVSRPYDYFLNTNSAILTQKLIPDVMTFIQNVFVPITDSISRVVMLAFLVLAAFFASPAIALGAAAMFLMYYALVFWWIRPRAQLAGRGFQEHNRGQQIATQELLGGLKPILVHGKSAQFVGRVKAHSAEIAPLNCRSSFYSNVPRYLIEPVAFGSLVAVVVFLAWRGKPFTNILPTIAVFALTGYRMLPNVQLLYLVFSNIAAYGYTLGEIESVITEVSTLGQTNFSHAHDSQPEEMARKVSFQQVIRLVDITFRYSGSRNPVLSNFSLEVPRNHSVGIMGVTGSGKSTLVDLILGLHHPSSGCLMVDDTEITEELIPAWRRLIGYVPQDIFLLDDSLAANIAFGIPCEQVNPVQLRRAAQSAQILDFIENELPQKFSTPVGERGVRLSGGQRQRIGIARALYHQPDILVLDEATSALDGQTEAAIMQTINALQGSITMIIIAHRLSTLEGCDSIVEIRKELAVMSA